MYFQLSTAEIFIPDGLPAKEALVRTTHLAVSAHHDDLEIMAAGPILECFQQDHQWFTGVVLTDGGGSPRDDLYKGYSDEAMHQVRFKEQRKAAVVGEYGALVMLDYPSTAIKDALNQLPTQDLALVLQIAHPQYVYTHNLADKHDTHVATALKVIAAIRSLPESERPQQLFGCEVWRDLDWMVDQDKVIFDLSSHENLQAALLGVFDSQICGGKRYDLATMGRRCANATYFDPYEVDLSSGLAYAMDLTPLIHAPEIDINSFVQEHIQHFAQDVADRLTRLGYRGS
jgi:LmbE family N-acetylglucosaminyl deacetylase